MTNGSHTGRRRAARFATVTLASALVLGGCEVINPGPVDDEFIDDPTAQAGLINGSWERMNDVIGTYAYNTSMVTREIFHGGQTGSYGQNDGTRAGALGGWTSSGPYNAAQQARWIAEEAIRRFDVRGDVSPAVMTQAYLAAGYANRMNGDFFCWGTINEAEEPGPLVTGDEYFKRAESWFTQALSVASDNQSKQAAHAGRAQARLWLKDYTGAIADAKEVPNDFVRVVQMDFSTGGVTGQANHVMWANADQPFRSWTTLYSYYHDYYSQTGDPRVPWAPFPKVESAWCVGGLAGYSNTAIRKELTLPPVPASNSVPCMQQQKYKSRDDDIRMASGPEMRLLEAEAMLRLNPTAWPQAMQIINALRTSYVSNTTATPLQPWTATNLDEAWTFLMRERSFETWLESRRFSDMRRWEPFLRQMPSDGAALKYGRYGADGATLEPVPASTPGQLDWPCYECQMSNPTNNMFTNNTRGRNALEDFSMPRELCYNISSSERANNPKINVQDEDTP